MWSQHTLATKPRAQNIDDLVDLISASRRFLDRHKRSRPLLNWRDTNHIKPRRFETKLRIQILADNAEPFAEESHQSFHIAQRTADIHRNNAIATVDAEQHQFSAQYASAAQLELRRSVLTQRTRHFEHSVSREDRFEKPPQCKYHRRGSSRRKRLRYAPQRLIELQHHVLAATGRKGAARNVDELADRL